MTSYVTPKKNTAFILYVGLEDKANAGLFKAAPTLAAGDFKVSIDGGTLNNLTDLPTVAPTGGKMVKITLTAAEMNGDNVTVVCSDAAGAEWYDLIINLQTTARQIDDLAYPTVSGRGLDVAATGEAGLDFDNLKAATGATVLTNITVPVVTTLTNMPAAAPDVGAIGTEIWAGTYTRQINSVSGTVTAQLADGVVHGGSTAELALKKATVVNSASNGIAVLLQAMHSTGRGLVVEGGSKGALFSGTAADIQGNITGTINGLSVDAQQDIADALKNAPNAGTLGTGSVYGLLGGISDDIADIDAGTGGTSEPAQLDWRAWATPDGALADLYDDNAIDELTHSGTTLTAEGDTGFAAWVLQEFASKLFIGVGKTPMNHIAAVIGSLATAGATPTFEYALPEEGVAAMCVGTDGKLYVAGIDERANTGDSSIYVRDTAGTWTRKQTVTGWQHICGIREDGSLWIAGQGASSCLMYSSDGGDTWTDTGLTLGRAYDVIRLGANVIATHWNGVATYTVHRSLTTPSFSWAPVSGIEGGTGRMVEWEGVIVGVTVSGKLFTVDGDGAGLEYTPPFTPRQGYNNLAVDTDGYLCALGTTGVWRTNDLTAWKQIWSFSPADTVLSLGTWGDDLVVSTGGATAAILARPASPEAAAQQMYRDALKLAASPGAAADGSTDADLADILTDTAAIKAITDDIDVSAVTLATGNVAGDLTFIVGATFDETLTGLTVIPSDWTECYFSLKREKDSDSDSASLIQVKVTNGGDASDGLLYVKGSAPASPVTKASAALTVTQAAGTVRIVVSAAAMALLTGGLSSLDWDLKVFRTGGWSKVVTSGNASIAWTPTRAVA